MCKAITDMINDGIEKGKIEAIEQIQKNLGLSLEEACAALEISVEEYEKAKAWLQTEV